MELKNISDFNAEQIFTCGQCFRFNKKEDGSFVGVAFSKVLKVKHLENGNIYINCDETEFEEIWRHFLDIDRDYKSIRQKFIQDDFTQNAADFGSGIRILKQDSWEALCSFILSQCNNIPRIKSIIDTLCKNFGDEILFEGEIYYTFPSAQKIASLSLDDLSVLKCGYRAPYVLNAAKAVLSGEIDFNSLMSMDTMTARKEILKQKGVGVKVADCFLLFGLSKLDAFPVDTWMKKAKAYYSGEMSESVYGEYAGIYQQYIFYYVRENGISPKTKG